MTSTRSARLSRICLGLAGVVAAVVCAGWALDVPVLKTAFQPGSSMKLNTALGIAGLAAAGWFGISATRSRRDAVASRLLSSAVLLLALLTFSQGVFGYRLGIDELLVADTGSLGTRWPPGRPSPVTLLNLVLLGLGIIGMSSRQRWAPRAARGLTLVSWVIAFQSVVSYVEGVNTKFGMAVYAQMAIHTSVCLVLIASGLILTRPDEGVLRVVSGRTESSRIGRALLFCAVFLPPSITWLQQQGEHLGFWDAEFGAILQIVGLVTFLSWVALKTAASLRQSEAAEHATQEALRLAIDARDEFLSIASHELRTPITGMKLRAQTMERRLNRGDETVFSPPKVRRMIEQTHEGLNRMSHLVEEMLDISRIQSGKLSLRRELISMIALVRANIERYSAQLAEAAIPVSIEGDEALSLQVDRYRMEQVLTNLVTNAIRYAPHCPVRIQVSASSGKVRLEFADGGPGIPTEHHERVFQRFERLVSADEVSGLGLGLYISRKIVEAHEGTIRVESSPNRGAIFVLEFPAAA